MPRKPKFNLVGIPQHVIQRANNREPCFYPASDYRRYLDDFKKSTNKYNCLVQVYVLMTNHVHLIKIGLSKNISKCLSQLQTGSPYKLKLMGWIEGDNDKTLEHELLKKYSSRNVYLEHNRMMGIKP